MARLGFLVLLLVMAAGHAGASWCICKQGLSESILQKALDYACGAGADCNPIHQSAACFNPNTVLAHCNFAVNSYFQRKGQAPGSCEFAGAATVTTSDPSTAGCVYPASASATPTPVTTTPITNNPNNPNPTTTTPTPTTTIPTTANTTTTPTTTTPGGGSPYITTPSSGVLGGVGSGLGPSGVGINTDDSHGGLLLQPTTTVFSLLLVVSGLVFLWG